MRRLKFLLIAVLIVLGNITSINVNADEGDADMGMNKADSSVKITVGKDNSYDFQSIQQALDSISAEPTEIHRATIAIAKGVYEEPITVSLPYVKFVNADSDNPEDVVITYDRASGHPIAEKNFGTQKSAAATIEKTAVGFSAENITFQNSYNLFDSQYKQSQAVALVSLADKVIFNNCSFIGRQDTLYLKGASLGQEHYGSAENARVYLKDCFIEGTVDFIFGDATAYFDNCRLNLAYHENGGHFTAANTTLFNIGYVFNNCTLTVDSQYTQEDASKIDLGRPWQSEWKYPYYGAHTVFIGSRLPDILKQELFSLWNDDTAAEKVRYYQYNSLDAFSRKKDTSNAAEWTKTLTAEQAAAYSVYNVLRGDDNWNPDGTGAISDKKLAADITLNTYSIQLPVGESETLIPMLLPAGTKGSFEFKSSDPEIMQVDENGRVTAVKEGNAVIYVTAENGMSACARALAMPPQTAVPVVSDIKINADIIKVGSTLSAAYSYELKSDEAIDTALLRWYAVKDDGAKILLKEGNKENAASYKITDADVGYKIQLSVFPMTETTYGEMGAEAVYVTPNSAEAPEGGARAVYLREGFNSGIDKLYENDWAGCNSDKIEPAWTAVDDLGNTAITAVCDENTNYSFLQYAPVGAKAWRNADYSIRLSFNPELKGLNAESYFDIYTSYTDKEYYKYRFIRGGNTNSLKVYLYKKTAASEEELVASDEDSLKNIVFQNSGSDNSCFTVHITTQDAGVRAEFTLDGASSPAAVLEYEDETALNGGFIAFEAYGRDRAVLIDSVTVMAAKQENTDKVKIFLAGDSTVKSYGDDSTIGGWGEFLPYYLDSNEVEVINKAEGGRSSRSFINQGRLDEIISQIGKGDYLFIQFGHNDARTDEPARIEHSAALGEPDANGIYPTIPSIKEKTPQRIYDFYKDTDYTYEETFYPYSSGTYKWFLKQYVEKAREKGATPVLITPVARVFFDDDGKIVPHHGENNGYVEAMLQLAKEMRCAYVDMYTITKEMYESYGVRVTQGLQNVKEDSTMDITHYNKFGSNIVTSLMVKALADQHIDIAKAAVASDRYVARTEGLKSASVYVVGGSTASSSGSIEDYAVKSAGWGEYIDNYFVNLITVQNLALAGETSKSFIKTDRYKKFTDDVSEGDYVLIEFGSDSAYTADMPAYYTDPLGDKQTEGSYKYYLYNYYIKPVQEKKATPFIISPTARRQFNADGTPSDGNGFYDDAVQELAAELMIPYISLTNADMELYKELGAEGTKAFHALYRDKLLGDNGIDAVNLSAYGARHIAALIVGQMKYSSATLKDYIDDAALDVDAKWADFITRADFVVMLMDIMDRNKEITTELCYSDVKRGKYYYNAVGNAFLASVISSEEDGLLKPENMLSYGDMKKMLSNAYASYKLDAPDFAFEGKVDADDVIYSDAFSAVYDLYLSI